MSLFSFLFVLCVFFLVEFLVMLFLGFVFHFFQTGAPWFSCLAGPKTCVCLTQPFAVSAFSSSHQPLQEKKDGAPEKLTPETMAFSGCSITSGLGRPAI